jgi:hypothetical protein
MDGPQDPRLIYAIFMAAISVALALILLPPIEYSYYSFILYISLFFCWIVCFALLEDISLSLPNLLIATCGGGVHLGWTDAVRSSLGQHLHLGLVYELLGRVLEPRHKHQYGHISAQLLTVESGDCFQLHRCICLAP